MADAFSPPVVKVGAGLAGLFCAVHLHASGECQHPEWYGSSARL
jgi:uncharacterized protein with NAD-binding domain and iron-sulfur cluster